MAELVKAVKQFIYRDILFILGGASVILSWLYLFDSPLLPRGWKFDANIPVPFYLIGAGFAYVLGYVVQDFFSIFRITTTAHRFTPWCILQWIYQRFEHRPWRAIPELDPATALFTIDTRAGEHVVARHDRIVALMQIGTTVGPCWVVAGVPLIIRAYTFQWEAKVTALAAAVVLSGGILIILGWLKAAQRVRFLYEAYEQIGAGGAAERGGEKKEGVG